jgi:organic hydroperoxide reductase OsmC/OhrA
MELEPVKYPYDTNLIWNEEKKGILKSKGKPDVNVACPPEFGGHPGIWAPGDLFVGSIEVCLMTTFLWHANRKNLKMNNYLSNAQGIVEQVDGIPRFSSVTVKIKVDVESEIDKKNAEIIIKKIKHGCLISNSIDINLEIDSEISISGN